MQAPLPKNEPARLQALRGYGILDTSAEAEFDDFTLLAAHICGTPVALISLVDAKHRASSPFALTPCTILMYFLCRMPPKMPGFWIIP